MAATQWDATSLKNALAALGISPDFYSQNPNYFGGTSGIVKDVPLALQYQLRRAQPISFPSGDGGFTQSTGNVTDAFDLQTLQGLADNGIDWAKQLLNEKNILNTDIPDLIPGYIQVTPNLFSGQSFGGSSSLSDLSKIKYDPTYGLIAPESAYHIYSEHGDPFLQQLAVMAAIAAGAGALNGAFGSLGGLGATGASSTASLDPLLSSSILSDGMLSSSELASALASEGWSAADIAGLTSSLGSSALGASSALGTNLSSNAIEMLNSGSLDPLFAAASDGTLSSSELAAQLASEGWSAADIAGLTSATSNGLSLSNILSSAKNLFSNNSGLLSTGLNMLGGYLQGNAAQNASQTNADAIVRAAQIAADAAKFRPVGITTNFGQSKFGYDANGNLTSAGYSLSPQLQAQQNQLMGQSNSDLAQYLAAQGLTAPLQTGAQTAMNLGQGYLSTDPKVQAAKYMADQQALLAPGNERNLSNLMNTLQQQGRMGLATGGTSTMAAANPDLEAYYNAINQQNNQLAANATQGGMDYAKFGAGMLGTGSDLLNAMYKTQTNAYTPYQTTLGGAQSIEGLGQNPLDIGINLGAKGSAAGAQSGQLLSSGIQASAPSQFAANSYSPWAGLFSGAGNAVQQYTSPQQQYKFDPFTGRAL